MPTEAISTEELLGKIQEHVWLVSLTVGWPKMSHQIADAEVTIKTEHGTTEVDEAFRTSPQWQLIPEEWKEKLSNLEGRARRVLGRASVQFAAKGSCLLPIHRAPEVFQQLRELRTDFYSIRDQFVAAYGEIMRDIRAKLGDEQFARAAAKLPTQQFVSGKFRMTWAIIPLAGNSGPKEDYWEELKERVDRVSAYTTVHGQDAIAELHEHIDRRHTAQWSPFDDDQALLDTVREAKESMAKMVEESIEAMVNEPRQEVAAAVQHMIDMIKDEKTVRQGTLDQISRAFDRLKSFSFIADDQLVQQIRQMEKRIDDLTPQAINSNRDVGLQLAGALRPILQAATDEARAAKAGQRFRHIRFRPTPEPATA
jgi:hypothetical protein